MANQTVDTAPADGDVKDDRKWMEEFDFVINDTESRDPAQEKRVLRKIDAW